MWSLIGVLAVGAAAVGACGCGGNDETSPLSDGRHFAYIQTIDTSSTPATLTIDTAEFLSGEEANRAAAEDGVIEEERALRTTTTCGTRTRRRSTSPSPRT
jgi:hypothetical protein